MFNAANPASILVPMLAIVLLTFVGFIRMAAARGAAVKGGHDPAYYKAQLGTPEPEATVVAVRHYGNLFEMPTIFYAACLTAFVLPAVSMWTLIFAWAYVAARYVQSAIHLTGNNTSQRGGAFVLGVVCMIALWVNLGMAICGKL
jgi:hypothetical protein